MLFRSGDPVVVLESMKMEVEILSPQAGFVHDVLCKAGQTVDPGQVVVVMSADVGDRKSVV